VLLLLEDIQGRQAGPVNNQVPATAQAVRVCVLFLLCCRVSPVARHVVMLHDTPAAHGCMVGGNQRVCYAKQQPHAWVGQQQQVNLLHNPTRVLYHPPFQAELRDAVHQQAV
jgi:hypothetical protein